MFKNIKNFSDFTRQVEILWIPDYEDRKLEIFPCTVTGGFTPSRIDDFLKLARLHPEYHKVVCIEPNLYVNAFVKGAQTYHLAEGDADPKLIHDLNSKLDTYFLQSLNSGRNKRRA